MSILNKWFGTKKEMKKYVTTDTIKKANDQLMKKHIHKSPGSAGMSTITASTASTASTGMAIFNNISVANSVSGTWATSPSYVNIPCLTLYNSSNQEIVKLEHNGTVKWASTVDVDAAAEAFARSLGFGAERSAGITTGVKQRMRDTVFEEIISIAEEKGTLTAEELTYLWQAAKIMDKLKGKNE